MFEQNFLCGDHVNLTKACFIRSLFKCIDAYFALRLPYLVLNMWSNIEIYHHYVKINKWLNINLLEEHLIISKYLSNTFYIWNLQKN